MFRRLSQTLLAVSLVFSISCGGKNPPSAVDAQTPNVRSFPIPFKQVWKTTLEIVEFDFLMGIEFQEIKRGFFSTEMIRDYQPFQKRRFRVSGTLAFDGQTTIVKLYKHEEILVDNDWKAIPSNSMLENQMLDRISKKLAALPQPRLPPKRK